MAHILVNAFQLNSIKATAYEDVNATHPYYKAINILSGNQITTGYPDGTYKPNRLQNPLLLFDVWMAPLELFEKMGFALQEVGQDFVSMQSIDHGLLNLRAGETRLWIGDKSVELNEPLMKYNGQLYIDAHPILQALEKPLVFYPEQFLIALEAPQVTAAQIMSKSPSTALNVVHTKQPYWHWNKKDKDYLELISINNQVASKKLVLLNEMKELTSAYNTIESEIEVINSINYISDHVSGKLDAVSRAIEARYNLLFNNVLEYPEVGKSGGLGLIGQSKNYSFDYLVFDHSYEHIDANKQRLINALNSKHIIDLNMFAGLEVFGVPFSISEKQTSGHNRNWAGLAAGSSSMFVIHSGLGTFYHELGHNWDAILGNDEQYLAFRNKSSYKAASNEWADGVHENFAEDFVIAVMPEASVEDHRGVFGQPTQQQKEAIQNWIVKQSASYKPSVNAIKLNNITIIPDVLAVNSSELSVKGVVTDSISLQLSEISAKPAKKIKQVQYTVADISNGMTITLPEKGIYELIAGPLKTIIVYE